MGTTIHETKEMREFIDNEVVKVLNKYNGIQDIDVKTKKVNLKEIEIKATLHGRKVRLIETVLSSDFYKDLKYVIKRLVTRYSEQKDE